jgi:PAS domain S-box-containing protein
LSDGRLRSSRLPARWVPAIAAVALAGFFATAIWLSHEADMRASEVEHTLRVQNALGDIGTSLLQAETGQRGFLITANDGYLVPYGQAAKDLTPELAVLARLTAGNPDQLAKLAELKPLIEAKLDELAAVIEMRRSGDETGTRERVRAHLGRNLMDHIRSILKAMDDQEERLLAEGNIAAKRSARAELAALAVTGVLGLALVVIWGHGMRRYAIAVEETRAERDRVWRLSRDLLAVADADGRLLAINPAWSAVLGWSEPELLMLPSVAAIQHPDDRTATGPERIRLLEGRATPRFEGRLRRKDGSYRSIAWTAVSDGELSYLSGRDVTAEREQANALRQTETALRQAQKMEAIGQLTGGVAHDFNNMLAIVIGSLNLVQRQLDRDRPNDSVVRRFLSAALEGADRAAVLTSRLLAFSRQQALNPEPLDANKMVSGMSELLRRTLGEPVQIETVLAGGLWLTRIDPPQLENAILNLALNARDAMAAKGGGRLTIETANASLDEAYAAQHDDVSAGQYVQIAVSDSGGGMPPEVAVRAFDPFFTTKPAGQGTGLGLSMVHGFVKQSGGHVKIYSEPGQGTTIKLYLPRWFGSMERRAGAAAVSNVLPMGTPNEIILVVEDEERVRRVSVEALRELGYTVLHAADGQEALGTLDANPAIALLFTDIVMPGMNGAQLTAEALLRRPDLKVLYTTGYTRNAVVHNGVLDNGVQLLNKPFTLEQLATKVREVLGPVTETNG